MPDDIDPRRSAPIYVQLAAILREQIRAGRIEPDTALPSKRELQERYHVSPGTSERAFKILRDEGLVRTVPGRGVFVVEVLPER